MVVGVHAGHDALRMVLAQRVRGDAEGQGGRDLHLLVEVVLQRLLVERDVIAAPHGAEQEIGLGRDGLRDVRGELRRAELGPGLGDDLDVAGELLHRDVEVVERVAPIGIIRVDVGDLRDLRPRRRGRQRRHDAVGRLDVGHPEHVMRVRHGLLEQEIGAAVVEQREDFQLLGHRTQRRRVAARDDAGEAVDVLRQLHATQFLDVGVGPGRLVGLERLDLALAEQAALGIDLVGGEHVALVGGLAQHRRRAGEERHVTHLVRLVRDGALRLRSRCRRLRLGRSGQDQRARARPERADRDAEALHELATADLWNHVVLPLELGGGCEGVVASIYRAV